MVHRNAQAQAISSKPLFLSLYLRFLYSLIIVFFVGAYLYIVPPEPFVAKLGLFVLAALACFTIAFVFTKHKRLSSVISLFLISSLLLQFLSLLNIINFSLLLAFVIALFFLTK